jgi:hypothetical protein
VSTGLSNYGLERSGEAPAAQPARWAAGRRGMTNLHSGREAISRQLEALRKAVAGTSVLASILDDAWFKAAESRLCSRPTPGILRVDPSGLLLSINHPLRGVDWFEADQNLFLNNRGEEIDADGHRVLWLLGVDPLRTFIPLLESRLAAFQALPFKAAAVRVKLDQLRSSGSDPSFKNHVFEVSVLGDLALKGVLTDIDEDTTAVDGVLNVAGREILVEATNTAQEVIPDFTGVMALDPDIQIDQVLNKIRKKVADGRQLALVRVKPTVLFVALTRRGADRVAAEIAIGECFRTPEFAALSAVVVADSWRFQATSWHAGVAPDIPLHDNERNTLAKWYSRRSR